MDPQTPSVQQSEPPVQSTITTPPQENNVNRILIAIVVVLAVVTAITGGYWFLTSNQSIQQVNIAPTQLPTPLRPSDSVGQAPSIQPDQFAGWKTISDQYWFFKIPPDWHFLKCESHEVILAGPELTKKLGPELDTDTPSPCGFEGSGTTLLFMRFTDPRLFDIPKTSTSVNDETGETLTANISNKKEVVVDGKQGMIQEEELIYSIQKQMNTRIINVYIKLNDVMYNLSFSNPTGEQYYKQILSTFRFTNSTVK